MKTKNVLTFVALAVAAFYVAKRRDTMTKGGDTLEFITYENIPSKRGVVGGLYSTNLQATAPING